VNWILLGVGAYLVLGMVRTSEINAAVASCGGPMGSAAQVTPAGTGCAALNAVNQRWAWYPTFQLNF
jgi:hypothetical protein